MKKAALFCLGLLFLSVSLSIAQDKQATNGMVLYDPLFWKDELKLDNSQCQRIREINSEYYNKLSVAVNEERNHKSVEVKAAQSLLERSEEIWETFHPKQRKRWKKMWQESSPSTI